MRRSLSVWQAVGLSVALMAPSMAANINPQGTAGTVGRAVPLAFLLAAVGVLLVAYGFVRLCQYFHHAGSVYAFVGATLGPRAGLFSGFGLLGTYCFYGVVTASAGSRRTTAATGARRRVVRSPFRTDPETASSGVACVPPANCCNLESCRSNRRPMCPGPVASAAGTA